MPPPMEAGTTPLPNPREIVSEAILPRPPPAATAAAAAVATTITAIISTIPTILGRGALLSPPLDLRQVVLARI
ncbi:sterility protein Ste20, cytosolic regulator Pianissimo, subunit of TORC2 [Histoplasma capsulatum G186AR]|uniref:Sterility protein Ste20, cytosolic regulator Pianissimo, subunit of TORC2 n=1 Tax=Ajellomyces capsulatus TaxID=5037 RepID=A0A8H7YRD8_AJECA|nr:sterility protein Ste20, cytosolic regulator Pianissimo, subunit of TORC2 [Histoplasma capsulatum]QSS74299.1 sterility protein Ste20, cytosolic regulator Pianissimo, subunit of TORC2 [Histoplasma capsulatum G186AR]